MHLSQLNITPAVKLHKKGKVTVTQFHFKIIVVINIEALKLQIVPLLHINN